MASFKRIILPNGLRVILVPRPQNLTTTALVLVEAGSKYETKKNNGISHFLEHLCFKGTTTRATALTITTELESVGAIYNAFTSQEVTGYWAKVNTKKFDVVLDIVADLFANPVFKKDELEKEKGVVIEELNMYEDMPMRKVNDIFMELMYGDQPAGWDVGGTKEVIRTLTRDDVVKYRAEHYVAQATTVVIAGAFNEKETMLKIKKLFGGIPTTKHFSKLKVVEQQKKPRVLFKEKKSDQTHIIIGCRAFDMFDKRRYALEVLGDIVGGGMSSRLFQKVRDELGTAYYIRAGSDLFTDHGFFAVSTGLDNKRVHQVVRAILDELKKISTTAVSPAELRRSKNHLMGTSMIGLETTDSLATFYGDQEIFHKTLATPEEMLKKIEAVTASDILSVARTIIKNKNLNMALIGPAQNQKELEKLLTI